ncbi:hypothetical protein [Streptomyces sp. MUSC 14]|uniref:hypothetical protein n=1 Tax=Streptomyces sp. MUSC 14 TaxID=1354889 RepID=UPI00210F1F59|nr:hypothetical protein [Streptomyces sp. MUSC 14]
MRAHISGVLRGSDSSRSAERQDGHRCCHNYSPSHMSSHGSSFSLLGFQSLLTPRFKADMTRNNSQILTKMTIFPRCRRGESSLREPGQPSRLWTRMGATTAAMVTAVGGVLGTLLAPVITTWTTKRQRAEERQAGEGRRVFEERRAACSGMNRASRHFHTMLKDALHRMGDGVYTDDDRAQVEEAR